MKRGGAGNPLGEYAVSEDVKHEDEKGSPLGEYAVFEDMKQAVFEDMKQEDEKGWSR